MPPSRALGDSDEIEIASGVLEELASCARARRPREACGVLIGRGARIFAMRELGNVDPRPGRFEIDPAGLVAVLRECQARGREVCSTWHSHVDLPAEPSPSDIEGATRAWLMAIVATHRDGSTQVALWGSDDPGRPSVRWTPVRWRVGPRPSDPEGT